jgi:hypothetical protein
LGILTSEEFGPILVSPNPDIQDEIDGWSHISKIEGLLDEAVGDYRAGDYEKSKELVIEAYIYHYKIIMPDIEEDDHELASRTDKAINDDLLAMIANRSETSQIESQVIAIKTELQTAKTVVVPEFPLSILIMAAVIGSIVVVTAITCNRSGKDGFIRGSMG